MPDRTKLKIGDKIKITGIPEEDLKAHANDTTAGNGMLSTAAVLEKIMTQYTSVTIDQIDEYGKPWFSVDIKVKGQTEHHTIAIMDDDSWELMCKK